MSHAYTLDHRQEEQLFADLEAVIDNLRAVDLTAQGADAELSRQVRGSCGERERERQRRRGEREREGEGQGQGGEGYEPRGASVGCRRIGLVQPGLAATPAPAPHPLVFNIISAEPIMQHVIPPHANDHAAPPQHNTNDPPSLG